MVVKNMSVDKMEDIVTNDELSYIKDDNSDVSLRISFSWHYEDLYVLGWIISLDEWNCPDHLCDVGKMVRDIKRFNSIKDFCKKAVLDSKKEILNKVYLIYRMYWALLMQESME